MIMWLIHEKAKVELAKKATKEEWYEKFVNVI